MTMIRRAALPLACCAFLLSGCDELRGFGQCSEIEGFAAEEAADRALLPTIPNDGPYPMALLLSQPAVNRLLRAVTDHDLPPMRETYLGFWVELRPSLPLLQLEEVPGCAGCVLADLDFKIHVGSDLLGEFGGTGSASLGFPLALAAAGERATTLTAGLAKAVVRSLDLKVEGLALSAIPSLQTEVEKLAQRYVREEFGDEVLATLDSWEVGEDRVLLAGRGPVLLAEERTLLIGLHSNLPLEAGTSVDAPALPVGAEIGLHVHPGLLAALTRNLLGAGELPREYDEAGNASEDGGRLVTLSAMEASDAGALRTTFEVWQLSGLCGSAAVAADLGLAIDGSQIVLSAENLEIVDGRGAGELLSESGWLAGDFLASLGEKLELSLNYDGFAIGANGTKAPLAATGLSIDGRGLTVALDLID